MRQHAGVSVSINLTPVIPRSTPRALASRRALARNDRLFRQPHARMRQHAGVFAANFSSNLLWQNCFAPKKSAFCAELRRVAAGILGVCQGGATMGLRQTRLLRRMFSYARRPNGRSFFVYGTAGRCGISPYGRFAAPLCRAGPACPAGINAYCAAGHMGPALRIILRPLRCRASPTGGRRGGRPCPPEQREALSFRASHRGGRPCPPFAGVGIR